ncbi:YopT-type cysteine protease domain-containing protein [Vibrio caribbeanicus]|uniref:YopT-type cysteine protease domain-containing protein n=1 Tax=Vibrio caribbeanicus TaxID=701175 RepID=UPI0030D7D2AB
MNNISNISVANLTALAAQAKSENNEVRTDNSGTLKEKESSIGLSIKNNKARQQHRDEAISAIKTAIKQEYGLADEDVNKLMGGPKEKITIGDLKSLLSASEKLDQFSKKQKTELKAEIKQIEKQVATNSSAIATIKSDIQEKYQNLSDEDINQLVGNTKKELISEKIITGENKTLLDKSKKLSDKLSQFEANRKAEVSDIQQQVTRNRGFAGLLKAASISVAQDLGITTYHELKSASESALANDSKSKMGKNMKVAIKDVYKASEMKAIQEAAMKASDKWDTLSQSDKDTFINKTVNEINDKIQETYVDQDFVGKMASRMLSGKTYFNELIRLGVMKDAHFFSQMAYIEDRMAANPGSRSQGRDGMCQGMVNHMAVEISKGNYTSSLDFLATFNNENYALIEDLFYAQLTDKKYSSITEDVLNKPDIKRGVKKAVELESGFNEIELRFGKAPGGHALAVYAQPNLVTFFDPNYGMFEFENTETATALELANAFVGNFIDTAYPEMPIRRTKHFDI